MPDTLSKVQPGDLITSELINSIIDRLGAVENSAGDTRLFLGPLAANTHTLLALAAGFEDTGGIWLNGVSLLAGPPRRGINLVILDPQLGIKFRGVYDTFANAADAEQLAADLRAQTSRYDLVAAISCDAYTPQLTSAAKAALAAVGGAALASPTSSRAGAAFLGVVPENKASVRFDYFVSVIPSDGPGFGSERLAGLPLAWGLYSIPLQRFVLGGATGYPPPAPKDKEKEKEEKEKEKDTKESKEKDNKERKEKDSKELRKEFEKDLREFEVITKQKDQVENPGPLDRGDFVRGRILVDRERSGAVGASGDQPFIRSGERPGVG